MNVAQLSSKLNLPYHSLLKILKGTRRASPKLAKILEKQTGIPRLSWLYPEEFHNPLIEEFQNTYKGKKEKGLPDVRKLTSVK